MHALGGSIIGKHRPVGAHCPQGEPMISSDGVPLTCSSDAHSTTSANQLQTLDNDQCPAENYVCHVLENGGGFCCPDPSKEKLFAQSNMIFLRWMRT